jgi:hypothetical protein
MKMYLLVQNLNCLVPRHPLLGSDGGPRYPRVPDGLWAACDCAAVSVFSTPLIPS